MPRSARKAEKARGVREASVMGGLYRVTRTTACDLGTTGPADIPGTSVKVSATGKDGAVARLGTLESKDGTAAFTDSRSRAEDGSIVRRVFRTQWSRSGTPYSKQAGRSS